MMMMIDFPFIELSIVCGVFGTLLFLAAVVCAERSATPGGAG